MKLTTIFKVLLAGVMMSAVISCEKTNEPVVETSDQVSIMLDVDKLSLESASIRVRHSGSADMLWIYLSTSDLETPAIQLLEEKIDQDHKLTGEVVVYTGQNKSVSLTNLLPKSYYRFICASLDPVSGQISSEPAELQFRTRRDPAVFEKNDNWSITVGDRSVNNQDKMEYDNFLCKSVDSESYIVLPIKEADFETYYKKDIRSLFEDYVADFGYDVGDSKWRDVVLSGNNTYSEQRLRSSDWIVFMIGIDKDGELTGLYQQLNCTIEQETATDEYKRWLGTWKVSKDDNVLFEIQIIPSENNMWYYMGGWESTNLFQFDTSDPALMPELYFDKETGNMYFVSQYLNTLTTDAEALDFYFTGTFTYGSTYVLGDEVLNFRMAESLFVNQENTEARINSLEFVNSGMLFPIESICYMYYNGTKPTAISLEIPTLPLTLTKVNE